MASLYTVTTSFIFVLMLIPLISTAENSTSAGNISKTTLHPSFYKNDTKLYTVALALFIKKWRVTKNNCGSGNHPARQFMLRRSHNVVVSQDGTGNFTTISDAVSAAPKNRLSSEGYFTIYVKAGVYKEYIFIHREKRYLMIIGDGINRTVITGNHNQADGWLIFNSATFAVDAPYFVGINLTVRNTAGPAKYQAVAVRNGADSSTFYKCSFEGYQDTLYTHTGRQFYRECDVYGTVDFIFGNAAALFQNCNIYPRLPMTGQFNVITAQGRTGHYQTTGISIHNCTIRAASDLASSNTTTVKTYLGRPWKTYSRTVYMQSFMDNLINPVGWQEWNEKDPVDKLYYAEYNNRGPASGTSARVTWPGYHVINAKDALNFTVSKFLQGDDWLPQTGVPYTGGLI